MDEGTYRKNVDRVKALELLQEAETHQMLALGEQHGFIRIPDAEKYDAQSLKSMKLNEVQKLERAFYANSEGVPRQFVHKYDEYLRFMGAVRGARVAGNQAAFGKAQNAGFENQGEEITYTITGSDGKQQKQTYTYKVGNVMDLLYTTPAQLGAKVMKDMYDVLAGQNSDIESFERGETIWFNGLLNSGRDWGFKQLEEIDAKGGHISPNDYTQLQRYRNAKARVQALATDGMQMGKPRPEGQTDKNIPGESSVLAGRTIRNVTNDAAQWQTALLAIQAQVGQAVYHSVLNGTLIVRGIIDGEDRTYTVVVQDAKTGKEIGRAKDVQNLTGSLINYSLQAAYEDPSPTQ
jgi:hypothetical protein